MRHGANRHPRRIQRQQVHNQEQLRRWVRAAGFDVTKATLSRMCASWGWFKGGARPAYQEPAAPDFFFVEQGTPRRRRCSHAPWLIFTSTRSNACTDRLMRTAGQAQPSAWRSDRPPAFPK